MCVYVFRSFLVSGCNSYLYLHLRVFTDLLLGRELLRLLVPAVHTVCAVHASAPELLQEYCGAFCSVSS